MGQRGIHKIGFAGNLELLLPLHAVQRPHVVQAVGNLDQNDPDVVAQREQHLPEVLRLGALCGVENSRNLGQSIDDGPLTLAKHPLDIIKCHPSILYRVMEQSTNNAGGVQPHLLSANPRNCHRVEDVSFA